VVMSFVRHSFTLTFMTRKSTLFAEFAGTYVLVFGGTGSAVLAAKFLDPTGTDTGLGIGFVGVALAFGLTVLTMAYAVGHISGGHFNPAITIGLASAKRFDWKDAPAYIITQVVAAIAASATLCGRSRSAGTACRSRVSPPVDSHRTDTASTRRASTTWHRASSSRWS